jgi:tRNA(Arg) A34 adenosine deaminase TadA
MITKRTMLLGLGGLICVSATKPARAALPPIAMERHERAMRLAIEQARKNPGYPYGAVIVTVATGEPVAAGVNDAHANPILHGEIVCMNDYVKKRGNRGWEDMILYTTCEPCPMCTTALLWARIGGIVFASSSSGAPATSGLDPIKLTAKDVIDATPFHKPMLLGGVLEVETDKMFIERKRN